MHFIALHAVTDDLFCLCAVEHIRSGGVLVLQTFVYFEKMRDFAAVMGGS